MKIFFVSHSSEMAGAEQSLIRLVDKAAARGHSLQVSVPATGPLLDSMRARLDDPSRIIEIPTHRWMGQRSRGLAGLVRVVQCLIDVPRFVREYQRARPDVVLVNTSVTPAPIVAATILRIPAVTIIREAITSNPTLKSFLPKVVIRKVIASLSTRVIAVSRYIAEQYEHPSVVIHPQIDPVFFNAGEVYPEPRESETALRAVMLGYFTQDKGQIDAILAIRYLHDAGIRMTLDLYGAGDNAYYQKMKDAIRVNGLDEYVKVHSPTSNALDVLRKADVSLVCSRNEGFGKVTAESLLAGTPVVAYALGGTCEILEVGGGQLVDPSPHRLAEALIDLSRNPSALTTLKLECKTDHLRERLENTAGDIIDVVEHVARTS